MFREVKTIIFQLLTISSFILVAAGCDLRVHPNSRRAIYYTPLESVEKEGGKEASSGKKIHSAFFYIDTKSLASEEVKESEDTKKLIIPILSGVRQHRKEMFNREDIAPQLPGIEHVFWMSGHIFELIRYYQDYTKEHGFNNAIGHQLLWNYIRLGTTRSAKEVEKKLLAEAPSDPMVQFLAGAIDFRLSEYEEKPKQADPKLLKSAIKHWLTVLEIEPNFVGPDGISDKLIRQQIQSVTKQYKLEKVLPEDVVKLKEASQKETTSESKNGEDQHGDANRKKPDQNNRLEVAVAGKTQAEKETTSDSTKETAQKDKDKRKPQLTEKIDESNTPKSPGNTANQQVAYRIEVARGDLALANGDIDAALKSYQNAEKMVATPFEATFGIIRAISSNPKARGMVVQQVEQLLNAKLTDTQRTQLADFIEEKYGRIKQVEALRKKNSASTDHPK